MAKNLHYLKAYKIILCALILLCTLVGVLATHYILQSKTNNINTIQAHFDVTYYETESKIDTYKSISEFLFQSTSVKNYVEKTAANQSYNHLLVKKDIAIYSKILSNLGVSCTITDLSENCITISGIMPLKQYRNEYNIPDSLIENSKKTNSECTMYSTSSLYFFVFRHIYPSRNIVYSIITADKAYFLPLSENDNFLFSDKSNIIQKYKIPQAEFIDYSHTSVQGKLYTKSSIHVPDAIYAYVAPSDITTPALICIFILLIIAFLMCPRLARYISNIIYMPIVKIVDLFGQSEHDDDFEFLDSNIKRLIQNNQILATKLNKSEASIRSSFVLNLLYNAHSDAFASKYIDEYNLSYLNENCLCIILECNYNELTTSVNEYTHVHIIQNNYSDALKNILTDNQTGEFVTLDNSRFAFILLETSKTLLKNKLISILEISEKIYKIHPFIAIGRTVTGIKEIHSSFNDACEILTRRFDYMEKSILFFDELQASSTTFYYPIEFENTLIENTLYGEKENVSHMLSELINTNLFELSLDAENLTEFKFAITATIKRIVKMMGKTTCDIFGENNIIYLDISHAGTSEELKTNIIDIFTKLFEYKSANTTQKRRKLSSDILKFIEENYMRDISLTDISEYFSVSPGHISRILKNDIGIGFKEYLDNLRITESKKLLSTTNMTINRIAEKIGYNNTQTFNRLFKSQTGFSPKEYREKAN